MTQLMTPLTCRLTTPSDLSYSLSGGVGTLTLTVDTNDACFRTANPSTTIDNVGNSITFNLYAADLNDLVIVSTASNLLDGIDDTIDDPGVVGTLSPASIEGD